MCVFKKEKYTCNSFVDYKIVLNTITNYTNKKQGVFHEAITTYTLVCLHHIRYFYTSCECYPI